MQACWLTSRGKDRGINRTIISFPFMAIMRSPMSRLSRMSERKRNGKEERERDSCFREAGAASLSHHCREIGRGSRLVSPRLASPCWCLPCLSRGKGPTVWLTDVSGRRAVVRCAVHRITMQDCTTLSTLLHSVVHDTTATWLARHARSRPMSWDSCLLPVVWLGTCAASLADGKASDGERRVSGRDLVRGAIHLRGESFHVDHGGGWIGSRTARA